MSSIQWICKSSGVLRFAKENYPETGPGQEYKEGIKAYGDGFIPALKIVDGAIAVPPGAGVGLADAKEILKGAELVKS